MSLNTARLRVSKEQLAAGPVENTRTIGLMLYITALIVEHLNLDQIAVDDDNVQREIRSITEVRSYVSFALTRSYNYTNTTLIYTYISPNTRLNGKLLLLPLEVFFGLIPPSFFDRKLSSG